jgi:CheY-like chemotaxis protein
MAKILIAEDDLFLRDIYVEILNKEPFEITTAVDGMEALEKFKLGNWDLVLLDVLMPKMSGVDILKELREINPHTLAKKIVLMTNSDDQKRFEEIISLTDGYILKSAYTPEALVVKVKEYLQ